jgi:uncharacterized protein (DUF924 family)
MALAASYLRAGDGPPDGFMSDFSVDPQTIVDFWREASPDRWFGKDAEFDATVRQRFRDVHERAAANGLDAWAAEPTGALALILLLDQFPRNMFRGTERAYATDAKALAIAKVALERGDADTVGEDVNRFLALPLMHSEDLADQHACVGWMERLDPESLRHAVEHRDVVARFGRFPHRNAILGRKTSEEERAFLDDGGFAG